MKSTFIHEIRKKQKEYLNDLFDKYEQYSNKQFLSNLLNKSLNEIALYPFQDVHYSEVVEEVNDFINELTIISQYKKNSVFKLLCTKFLSKDFHIYNKKDRYDLKFIILKLLFLISESSRNENIKQVDFLYNKYFKEKKEHVCASLDINEKDALEDINNFNILEEKKYLDELYNTDDENSAFSSSLEEESEQEKNKKEDFDKSNKLNMNISNYKNELENNNTQSNFNNFYQTKCSYIENYMKNKNELTYENVIKKIFGCIYKYPHYENIKDKIKSKSKRTSSNNMYIGRSVSNESYNNYKNEKKYENKNAQPFKLSSNSSDEDVFVSLQKKQKKNKDVLFKSKNSEQYFFNNINLFDEENYDNTENEGNLIYETDIYNLHNVFIADPTYSKKKKRVRKQ